MAYNWGRWEKNYVRSAVAWKERPPQKMASSGEQCESLAADMRKLVHGMGATKVPVAPWEVLHLGHAP